MKKFKKFVVDIQKEESWIRGITDQGYRLVCVRRGLGIYDFAACEGKGRTIKIDYRTFQKQDEYTDYITMFEDSGWRHLSGTKSSGFQYYEKMKEELNEDIFSDKLSQAERYKRLSKAWLDIFVIYLPFLAVLIGTGVFKFQQFAHWKELYLTPGLWEMSGTKFLFSFLFETPFVIMRGFAGLLFLLLLLIYAYFGLRALWYYRKERN